MMVKNMNGQEINFEVAVELMNDEVREEVHAEVAPCTEQEFFTAYEKAHFIKFGELFELSKENPVY